ncbi:MAG TPA: PEP-CTERM sorting domain-containing protein [Phycisphaerae bacterium]|nr:PEP-CTERM sorting domain-containing protein [Phycisphaerae bacterium]
MFMQKKHAGIISGGAVLAAALFSGSASANITFTGLQLAGLTYSAPGPGATAGYVPTSGGYAQLTSPDNVSSSPGQFEDTGMLLVPSGYLGATPFGTLSNVLAQGTAGNISFNLSSMTPVADTSNYAYWNVELANPSNSSDTIVINAYGDNILNANPLNQGVAGNSSVDTSAYLHGGSLTYVFGPWSSVTGTSVDGTALGSWNVTGLTISVGGWDSNTTHIGDISSITVPGTLTPEPGSLGLMVLGGIGLLLKRRKTRDQG